jgi:hypothetical protein
VADQIREKEKGNYVARMEMRIANKILVGRPEREKSAGRYRRRWKFNIGKDLREIRWKGVDWIHLAQDRDQ